MLSCCSYAAEGEVLGGPIVDAATGAVIGVVTARNALHLGGARYRDVY